jgi:WD40 repeat protein
MSFDPRRSYLATTSQFGATRLWDAATGLGYGDELISEKPASLEPSAELPYLPRNRFSPDGGLLAVAGVDTRAMLWDVDPTDWRRRACAMAGRNLSREQWRLYLPGAPYRATCPEWPTG